MDASERWGILRLHVEDAIPLATLARTTGVAERTLQRWLARYRNGGYPALADGTRTDHGARRTAPELVRLIEGLALTKPRPSIATIHRQVDNHCTKRGLSAPSYSVVRLIVNGLDPGMVTLALPSGLTPLEFPADAACETEGGGRLMLRPGPLRSRNDIRARHPLWGRLAVACESST